MAAALLPRSFSESVSHPHGCLPGPTVALTGWPCTCPQASQNPPLRKDGVAWAVDGQLLLRALAGHSEVI
jgi:hypothetical protein